VGADPYTPAGLPDPLRDARQALALEQANVQRVQLQASRVEAERRLKMLEAVPSGDNGALLMVLEGLRDLRARLDQVQARAIQPPAPAQPQGLDYLTQLQKGWEAVQSIGGQQKLPSTRDELEMRVALDRLNMEREERQRRLDEEFARERAERDSARIRSEAVAQQIQQWGPVIGEGVKEWLKQRSGPNGSGSTAAIGEGDRPQPRPGLTVLTPEGGPGVTLGMIEGPCPSCGARLGIVPTPGQTERCPRCTTELAVVEGRIWPKLPTGSSSFAS
jgi:hypothetical protein